MTAKIKSHIGTYIHETFGDTVSYQDTFTTAILHQQMKWGGKDVNMYILVNLPHSRLITPCNIQTKPTGYISS